jgi:hypothetical protein
LVAWGSHYAGKRRKTSGIAVFSERFSVLRVYHSAGLAEVTTRIVSGERGMAASKDLLIPHLSGLGNVQLKLGDFLEVHPELV